jgi:hypothetical protein
LWQRREKQSELFQLVGRKENIRHDTEWYELKVSFVSKMVDAHYTSIEATPLVGNLVWARPQLAGILVVVLGEDICRYAWAC